MFKQYNKRVLNYIFAFIYVDIWIIYTLNKYIFFIQNGSFMRYKIELSDLSISKE